MKITPIGNTLRFGNNNPQDVNFDAKRTKRERNYKDPLQNYPLRLLGYTNDVGVAINELFPTFATLCWVPALMYFGADVYDKYKNKGNVYDPNAERAFSQAVFQANASIFMPMIFGHMGASAFSHIDQYRGSKLTTNAKEQTLRYIKEHSASEKIFGPYQNKEQILKDFEKNFDNFYNNSSKSYQDRNIFVKLYDKILGNSKRGAIATADKKRLTEFANNRFKDIIETSSNLDSLNKTLDKDIFKLKAWKSAGSFAALILTMKFIDEFTEKVLLKKIVEPQIKKIDFNKYTFSSFWDPNVKEVQATTTNTKA